MLSPNVYNPSKFTPQPPSKDTLNMISRDAWNEFVQCLSLYNAKVFDQAELLTMVGDMLGENPDLYDEFKVILSFHAAAQFANKLWAQLPISHSASNIAN